MRQLRKLSLTLLLLITAAAGAWAEESESITTTLPEKKEGSVEFTGTHFKITGQRADTDGMNLGSSTNRTITISALNGEIITKVEMTISFKFYSWEWEVLSTKGNVSGQYTTGKNLTLTDVDVSEVTLSASNTTTGYLQFNKFKIFYTMPAGTMTLNTDNTVATMTMPANDVTVNYTLVRDMQDATNPVAFSGLPTTTTAPIIVKKGDDGKYQPIETLTIQLTDPLAAEDAKNIIAADGITVKVLVGNGGTPIEYDQENPITLEAFLADMKPGYYWIKAEPKDENSPYDGTVYSSEFTVVEQYDLTVKPANDFSKGKIESVTVGSEQPITPDANGEATKTGIAPNTNVKIKAKHGYIIEKVEAKKKAAPRPLAEATAADLGKIAGADGNIYDTKADAEAVATGNAVAMIAYVGTASDCAHGLAIALADESGKKDFGAAGTACSGKAAVTGGTWRLPSIKDWQYMFIGCGASGSYSDYPSSMSYSGLASKLTTAQGDALQPGYYWSSTEYLPGTDAWGVAFDGSSEASFGPDAESIDSSRVRACLAF